MLLQDTILRRGRRRQQRLGNGRRHAPLRVPSVYPIQGPSQSCQMLVSANWNLFVGNCCSSSEVMLARYSPSLSQCFFAWYQALPVGLLEQHIAVLVAISALSAGVLVTNTARLRRFAANLQITIDHEVWGLQTALLAQKELVLVHLRRANG